MIETQELIRIGKAALKPTFGWGARQEASTRLFSLFLGMGDEFALAEDASSRSGNDLRICVQHPTQGGKQIFFLWSKSEGLTFYTSEDEEERTLPLIFVPDAKDHNKGAWMGVGTDSEGQPCLIEGERVLLEFSLRFLAPELAPLLSPSPE